MPDVVDRVSCAMALMSCHARGCRPCVLSKGGDVMPCPTSSNRELSYGGDCMSCPTSFDYEFCPKAVMSCHA